LRQHPAFAKNSRTLNHSYQQFSWWGLLVPSEFVNPDVPNTQAFTNATGKINPAFGRITAAQSGEEAGPRNIQMSLRFTF
jgi:hypothetical protein